MFSRKSCGQCSSWNVRDAFNFVVSTHEKPADAMEYRSFFPAFLHVARFYGSACEEKGALTQPRAAKEKAPLFPKEDDEDLISLILEMRRWRVSFESHCP